jgi:hypothetical protein
MDQRSLVGTGIDEAVHLEKSPSVEGFLAGLKAALVGAPVGAAIAAAKGANPTAGALIGGASAGALIGILKGMTKKVENLDTEAALRYHALNIKSREPMFFMPPKQQLGRYFTRRYD